MTCLRPVVLGVNDDLTPMAVPCGKCMPCRVQVTREWKVRLMNELHGKYGVFLTLTFDEENLEDNSLDKDELRRFLRRLEYEIGRFRHYSVGEYGSRTARKHYHSIVLTDEKAEWTPYKHSNGFWSSKLVDRIWLRGTNCYGTATAESIQYCTGYVRKKLNGSCAEREYMGRQAPFAIFSRGLGKEYALKNRHVFESDRGFTHYGKNQGVPRYYMKLFGEEFKKTAKEKSQENLIKALTKYGSYHNLNMAELSDSERRQAEIDRKAINDWLNPKTRL